MKKKAFTPVPGSTPASPSITTIIDTTTGSTVKIINGELQTQDVDIRRQLDELLVNSQAVKDALDEKL